jgi:hypothetical protein
MKEEFVIFQKYNDEDEIIAFSKLLDKNKIQYVLNDISVKFDPIMGNNEFGKEYCVKLKKSDFERANKILDENSDIDVSAIDKDYYLLHFSDNELIEIISRRDEWNVFDVQLAQKLLKERGKEITPERIQQIKNERIEELSEPEKSQNFYIFLGYLFAIFGGALGIFIGWHLKTYKKILPNGNKIFAYSENDRKQGRRIYLIGRILLVFYIILESRKIFF